MSEVVGRRLGGLKGEEKEVRRSRRGITTGWREGGNILLLHDWEGKTGEYSVREWQYCPSLRSGQYCHPRTVYSFVLSDPKGMVGIHWKKGGRGKGKGKKKKEKEKEKKNRSHW